MIVNGREAINDLQLDYLRKRRASKYYEDREVDLSSVPQVFSKADNLDFAGLLQRRK